MEYGSDGIMSKESIKTITEAEYNKCFASLRDKSTETTIKNSPYNSSELYKAILNYK